MRILMFALFLLPIVSNAQIQQSLVKFETENIDLGKVKKGDQVESAFTFTNISKEDVQIDIVSTCDCTEANWPQGIIKPGDSATIDFIFDSNQKEGEEVIELDVYFLNSDPKTGNPVSVFLSYTYQWAN